MDITLSILSILLASVSGFAKAISDLSEKGNLKFQPEKYWIKSKSWVNKWKLSDRGIPIIINHKHVERFFGSSRWFVALTDAWHLFNDVRDIGLAASFCMVGILSTHSAWYWFLLFNYPVARLVFHLFYHSKKLTK